MIAAAIATMATVDAARIMARIIRTCQCRPEAPPFGAFRLHARPHSALRTHARAVPPCGRAQPSGRLPHARALPACARAHAPACSGSSCRGWWSVSPCMELPTFLSLPNTPIASLLHWNAREESHIGHSAERLSHELAPAETAEVDRLLEGRGFSPRVEESC